MKKILYILLLVLILGGLIFAIVKSQKQEAKVVPAGTTKGKSLVETNSVGNEISNAVENEVVNDASNTANNTAENTTENKTENSVKNETTKSSDYIKTELDDGVLYSKDGKQVKADVVVNEKYYDTTINDMWTNPKSYMGKTIQFEGMYLENPPYTFVGRYSESNLCPNCPPGYSYFEYQLDGKLDRKFTDSKEWIKVIGTFEVGNDETTNYTDFYYLKVLTLEVMNKRGNDTVSN